ncbi:MAG: hypothetical protein COV69_03545 [Parcubacteria group bacterium CG11_big_fil_rev_8_21_14_0_20_39_14]|nr:MAG: hypothetical protein COV69_03545 [Parcubacteria group bacterium CG11_big_fil_rev_8_21_14_0_20_39_14]PIS35432.1 MAG: hypothetical protein COT36_02550 [Parcubacteria group bacterium CG08_land_8_20_14_0_20_38_56]
MLTPKQRRNKQIIVAVCFFLFWGGVAFGFSILFAPGPTCFDGIQNQGEEKIDCGGPCKPCPPILEKLKVLKIKAIQAETGSFDLLAQIENPNQEYGSPQVFYQFEIFGQDNNQLKKVEGSTYIFPSQTKYIIESPVNLSIFPAKVTFSIKNVNWEKLFGFKNVGLEIYEKKYNELSQDPTYFSKASGVVENTSNYDYEKVEIVVVLYDDKNALINFAKTEQKTVRSRDKRYFEVSWKKPFKKVGNSNMEAYTNLFLDENFIKRHGTEERFQQYY